MEELWISIKHALPWLTPVLFIVMSVFEFTKIPVNPWSWVFKKLSGAINKDINEKVDSLEKRIDKKFDEIVWTKSKHYDEIIEGLNTSKANIQELARQFDISKMESIRSEILQFSNSVRNGMKHSQEEWYHIIDRLNEYHTLIEKRGLVNGVIDIESKFILDSYRKCTETSDFSNITDKGRSE